MTIQTVETKSPSYEEQPTIASLLTARSPAAIAVIQLRGPGCRALLESCWAPATFGVTTEINSIRYGSWVGNQRAKKLTDLKQSPEDVVVCWTSLDRVEIHCHGGPIAANRILKDLTDLGACQSSVNPSIETHVLGNCSQDAWCDLPMATTERTTATLLDQARGALDDAILQLQSYAQSGELVAARHLQKALLSRADFGLRLTTGWRVAIAGPPNAGKSSLLNRILGYSRAIVHQKPGTTRDVLDEQTSILGWPITIVDTAGLRDTDCEIEAEGVNRANSAFEVADLILLTIEPIEGLTDLHRSLLDKFSSKVLGVVTKSDLIDNENVLVEIRGQLENIPALCAVSSKENVGIEQLFEAILGKLHPESYPPGTAIPFRQSHLDLIVSIVSKE